MSAELAVLEQQQKAQAAIDQKGGGAGAPGQVQTQIGAAVDDTVAAVKAAPQNAYDKATSECATRWAYPGPGAGAAGRGEARDRREEVVRGVVGARC